MTHSLLKFPGKGNGAALPWQGRSLDPNAIARRRLQS
jgi:hypothetical protein